MLLWTAFLIGFAGSLHCIGMCGPVLLALPTQSDSKIALVFGRLSYNFGRIVTYSFLGIIFGLLGSRLKIFGLQQAITMILGAMLILSVIIPNRFKLKLQTFSPIRYLLSEFKSLFGRLLGKSSVKSLFVIGLVNGLLPCGLVYVALAGAAVNESGLDGGLFMMAFGIGTFPLMFAASFVSSFISFKGRFKIRKLIPVFTVVIALLFIVRGLNLGIPYLSPKYNSTIQNASPVEKCH